MDRRNLLKAGAFGLVTHRASPIRAFVSHPVPPSAPSFSTRNIRWQQAYDRAINILEANVQVLPRFPKPVLIEGSEYAGVWQECGPHEGLVYRHFRPDVAHNNHLTFFDLQRPDGQLPANNKRTEAGFGQIQMVVPIAATAWEVAEALGDSELLERAYTSCSRWDAWLMRYRNTRGTGLVEAFCTYDTGMDNSPRWSGLPIRCPDGDARRCPGNLTLPRIAPDLSATVYGGRTALVAMARALGKGNEADRWAEQAENLRSLIVTKLYDSNDVAFYDLDAQNRFVKVRCDILSRICSEHVPDITLFQDLWNRQLGNPNAFWAPFPFPSAALDEPTFVRPIPGNSWGGASQALTALRAGRWMDHYGKSVEFSQLMQQWCDAIQRDPTFRQQIDPITGAFTTADQPNYSPAALVLYDFTWRLAGIHQEHNEVQWNVRPDCSAADHAVFQVSLGRKGLATMRYSSNCAELTFNGRHIATVQGSARIVTNEEGKLLHAIGTNPRPEHVTLLVPGSAARHLTIRPNLRITLG